MAVVENSHLKDLEGLDDRKVLESIYVLQKKTYRFRLITMILWITFIMLPLAVIVTGAILASTFVQKIDTLGIREPAEEVVQLVSDLTGISYKIGQIDVDKVNSLLEASESLPRIEEKLDRILGSQVIYQ